MHEQADRYLLDVPGIAFQCATGLIGRRDTEQLPHWNLVGDEISQYARLDLPDSQSGGRARAPRIDQQDRPVPGEDHAGIFRPKNIDDQITQTPFAGNPAVVEHGAGFRR
jgi:hypothetical protein